MARHKKHRGVTTHSMAKGGMRGMKRSMRKRSR